MVRQPVAAAGWPGRTQQHQTVTKNVERESKQRNSNSAKN
jgi:hypothetical protein